ncbi:CD9 antigen [Planococcus citri]|uniref:CD9 antigen n=1 Tax=Planococcus citri TaxID=170843 RepID=UPI0031F7DDAD
MSLTGCYAVMKYLVFLMNLVFWVSGLLTIVLSVWMLIDPTFYISMAQDESSYYSGICLLFLAGTLLFIVGFLGCFGAYNESQRLLVLFFCGLLLILVAQIATAVWAYSNSDKLSDLLRYTVRSTVQYEYGKPDSQRTDAFDAIQSGLKCCGAYGPEDWSGSSWKGEENELKLTMRSTLQPYEIPKSCCDLEHYTEIQCNDAVKVNVTAKISPVIYSAGCSDKLLETLREYMNTVIIITIAIGIVEFFALIISLILCCAIRAVTKYK